MSGFTHSVAGGSGTLIITALQSQDFLTGKAGWQISKAGNAEFNDVTVRGTFTAPDFIINQAGVFFYAGPPALGNLLLSAAPVAGTDLFGNPYDAGWSLYGPGGSTARMFDITNQPGFLVRPAGQTTITQDMFLVATSVNPGLPNEAILAVWSSGKNGGDDAAVQLFGETADGSVGARAVLEFGGVIGLTVTKTGVTIPAVAAAPPAPSSGVTLYYTGGQLVAKGPSGTPVVLATT